VQNFRFAEAWDIDDSKTTLGGDRHWQKRKWLNETVFEVKFVNMSQRNLDQE
jgi:hypothetical protein